MENNDFRSYDELLDGKVFDEYLEIEDVEWISVLNLFLELEEATDSVDLDFLSFSFVKEIVDSLILSFTSLLRLAGEVGV